MMVDWLQENVHYFESFESVVKTKRLILKNTTAQWWNIQTNNELTYGYSIMNRLYAYSNNSIMNN